MGHTRVTGLSLVALAGLAVTGLAVAGCAGLTRPEPASPPGVETAETTSAASTVAAVRGLDPAGWRDAFPGEYASYMASGADRAAVNGYGGGIAVQKLELYPEFKSLFAGSGFAKDYREDRGHPNAWKDLVDSGRVNDRTPGSCITCKTPKVAELHAEEGWAFARKPVSIFLAQDMPTVSCASCHEPSDGRLRITQPAFREAMAARGVDLSKADEAAMRTFVCAQCHVEYYFEPGTDKVIHPWSAGTSARGIYGYYATSPGGFAGDFVNPVSGARMLKAQHPDYEEFLDGPHAGAGLACADCHMPGGSHDTTSPLRSVEASCMGCHADRSPEWLVARVRYNQDAVAGLQDEVGRDIARSHAAIGAAAAAGVDRTLLDLARAKVREAQWYWDYVAAANSMGAHNPVGALGNLAIGLRLSVAAREALR